MAKEIISPKHKKFADEYIKTSNHTESYLSVFPKVNKETARVNGYGLLQKTTIQEYIKGITEKINAKAENKLIETLAERQYTNLLTAAEKRYILSQIARGEAECEDLIIIGKEVKKVKRKPTFSDIKAAIAEENKMTGDIAPTNQNIKITGNPLDVLIAENKAEVVDCTVKEKEDFKKLK